MSKKRSDQDQSSQLRQASLALTLPMLMVAGPVVGYFFAWLIIRWFDVGPPWDGRIRIIGTVIGALAGFRETVRVIKKISSEN